MKIRLRLSLWYFSITLVILLLFSLGTYFAMQHLLYQAMDEELDMILDDIEVSYNPATAHFEYLDHQSHILSRYLKQFYLMIYDSSHETVFSTTLAELVTFNLPAPQSQVERGYTVTLHKRDIPTLYIVGARQNENEMTFRILSRKLFHQNQQVGSAVIAMPMEDIEDSMEKLLAILVSGSLLIVVLIGAGSYFITRQALHPVTDIIHKARQISYSSLDERLPVYQENDEIGQLSSVLNSLFERLERAFQSQQQFLADAAHELKTPLSILRAHWEGEINNPELTLDMKERLVQDIETITRLSHLINSLLLLSKTEQIQSSFEFAPLQLNELLQEVLSDTQVLADAKNQTLSLIELQPAQIMGDQTRLYQLVFNLIDNASKYTPDEGNIWVILRTEAGTAYLEIRDNGVGIPEESLPHIFDRFFRVQKDRARKTGGSGLGLAIGKLIAEAHNGTIEVSSRMNEGTSFVVRLPLYHER